MAHENQIMQTLNGNTIQKAANWIKDNADAVLAKFGYQEAVLA